MPLTKLTCKPDVASRPRISGPAAGTENSENEARCALSGAHRCRLHQKRTPRLK